MEIQEQNTDVFTKPIKELMHQISNFAGAGRINRALSRANMTAILNAYVHLLSSTQSHSSGIDSHNRKTNPNDCAETQRRECVYYR